MNSSSIGNVRDRLNSDGFCELSNDQEPLEESKIEGPKFELPMTIEIETDYILTSHLGDWQKLYNEYTFSADQSCWNLRTEHPVIYKQVKEAIQKCSLSNGPNRQLAWSLLMGICAQNVKTCYKDLYLGYLSDAFNLEKSTMDDVRVHK